MNLLTNIHEGLTIFAMNFSENIIFLENYLREHYSPFYLLGVVIALMLLFRLFKTKRLPQVAETAQSVSGAQFIVNRDVEAIAGDNPMTTKLDLARAYMEMGKKQLAKNILLNIQKQGTDQQKQEAKKLFETYK